MRFLALALFVAAAASCCLAQTVRELVDLAIQEGAPFNEASLKALRNSDYWGNQRANRTTDVVIMNKSGKNFKVIFQQCARGSLSSVLMPESQLKPSTSSVFGMDSSKPKQGIHCTLVWEDSKDSYFTAMLSNPFFDDNAIYTTSSFDLKVKPTLGHGYNNQAIITVEEKRPMSMLGSSRSHSGSSRQQRGHRNIAIKASKSGSRYLTL